MDNSVVRDSLHGVGSQLNPANVHFGEATPSQLLQCYKLAAAAYGPSLSEADYIERETLLEDQPLTRNGGCRVWCLYLANASNTVLSTCKTIRRTILLKDAHGVREENGYCIASVVTSTEHRGQGLASLLLQQVAQWLDGPGQAAVSMLYSNKENFYAKIGWTALPAAEITLAGNSTILFEHDGQIESELRSLGDGDIAELCALDVQSLRSDIETIDVASGAIMVTVLPTAELISLQHARTNFMSLKAKGKFPQRKGVKYSSIAWLYWHHDFRKGCLYIQRIRAYGEDTPTRIDIIATLLLQAWQEAESWGLPRVVTWDLSSDVRQATELLRSISQEKHNIREARRRETISLRWPGGANTEDAAVVPNEAYAWN